MTRENRELYEFGEFRLDVDEHRLERLDGGRTGALPEKAFQTLVALLRKSGTLVTKLELISAVWPDAVVEENNLGKAVHAIRQVLKDPGPEYRFVETVPKHGYRFIGEAKRVGGESVYDPDRNALDKSHSSTAFPGGSPAYDLYVRGKVKAGSESIEETEDAIKVLEAAVTIDPYFAPAYAQLARAYNTRAFKFSDGIHRKLLHENADVAVEKALSLDPNLAEGHLARGLILWTNIKGFPHEQAIRAFQRSVSLDTDSDEAHHQLSMVYSHIGLVSEAQHELAKALEINPNNTMARFRVAVYLCYKGEFDEALRVYKTIPTDVSPLLVGRCKAEVLIQTGQTSEAEAIVDRYLRAHTTDEGGSFTSLRALLLAKNGKQTAAQEEIETAAKIGADFGHFHHTAHNIAAAYAALNRPTEAIAWLERAADGGFPNFTYFNVDPNLDGIRTNAGFVEFMSRMRSQYERYRNLADFNN